MNMGARHGAYCGQGGFLRRLGKGFLSPQCSYGEYCFNREGVWSMDLGLKEESLSFRYNVASSYPCNFRPRMCFCASVFPLVSWKWYFCLASLLDLFARFPQGKVGESVFPNCTSLSCGMWKTPLEGVQAGTRIACGTIHFTFLRLFCFLFSALSNPAQGPYVHLIAFPVQFLIHTVL